MSGLVAMFHLDGQPADLPTLQALAATLKHRAVDGQTLWQFRSAGLAFQYLRTTPESSGELQPPGCPPHVAIAFDGRLDNRDDLLRKLPARLLHADVPADSALVLAAYLHFGEHFAEQLNGDFAVGIFDGEQRSLLLARDIMGIRPLYYSRHGDTFLAASEAKAILAYPNFDPQPDEDALADLILGGDPYEMEHTVFKNVYRVLPGHTVVVTPGGLHSFQHWDFDTTKQICFSSVGEYAEGLRAVFEQAVRRRFRSSHRVAVSVSGGLDSSAIFCTAEKLRVQGEPLAPGLGVAMVFPDGSPADEKHLLSAIEAEYEVSIQKLLFSRFRFVDDHCFLWHTEAPMLDWNATLDLVATAQGAGCRVMLDGYYGDQMMVSQDYLFDLARKLRWLRVNRELLILSAWIADADPREIKAFFWRRFFRDLLPESALWFVRQFRRSIGNQYPKWYSQAFRDRAFRRGLNQRQPSRRFASKHMQACFQDATSSYRLKLVEQTNKLSAMHGLDHAYPFMDRDLIQFVMAIPGEMVSCEGVYKGLFREAMKGVLPEPIRQRNWKADFTALNTEAAASDFARFSSYLQPDSLAVTYRFTDAGAVQQVFREHRANLSNQNSNPTRHVNFAVGLELWLRVFFQEQAKNETFIDSRQRSNEGD